MTLFHLTGVLRQYLQLPSETDSLAVMTLPTCNQTDRFRGLIFE